MNLLKKTIGTVLLASFIFSCSEDDDFVKQTESISNGTGLTEISFSSYTATPGADANGLNDGTYVTVKPLSIGASTIEVDFGDPNSSNDVITVAQGESASYDYPNEVAEVTYTITVTAKANGKEDVIKSDILKVIHSPVSIDNAPASPTAKRYNVYSIFTDGADADILFTGYPIGKAATGGNVVKLASGNSITEFSRLGSDAGSLDLGGDVVIANAFYSGVGATDIHFDVHSNFAEGIDKLKITLVDNSNSVNYVIDGIDLTDGEWTSLDYNLVTDFSTTVVQFDEVKFELGTGGTSKDHATISVDNVYMSRATGSTIINGDFTNKQDFWKWGVFTGGETNPFGSSSDGSNLNYDGTDNGGKTPGAKWTSGQSAGSLKSSSSRYAYQELNLAPNTSYTLEYQYAIKTGGTPPIGGSRIVGLILDGQYDDGAEAADNITSNLGVHIGTIAQGKFSSTPGGIGTIVQLPFTSNSDGKIAVMFYAVTGVDSWIDNVKVY